MMRRVLDRRIAASTAESKAARAEIAATIEELRQRIHPRVLAAEAAEGTVTRATRLVQDLGDAARTRPWIIAAGASAFGLALTLRAKLKAGNAIDEDAPDKDKATNADA